MEALVQVSMHASGMDRRLWTINQLLVEAGEALFDGDRASVATENTNLLKHTDKRFAVCQGHPHLEAK